MAKNPGGRPSIHVDPRQVELLAGLWLTKESAADFLGVARETLFLRMRTDPEIEEAWARGRAKLQATSMQGLIRSAQNGSVRAQIFLAERVCGLDGRPKSTESIADTARDVRDALKAMIATEVPDDTPAQDGDGAGADRDA